MKYRNDVALLFTFFHSFLFFSLKICLLVLVMNQRKSEA